MAWPLVLNELDISDWNETNKTIHILKDGKKES